MHPEVEFMVNLKENMESEDLFAKELEDDLMKYTCDYEEKKTEKIPNNADMRANIMECSNHGGNEWQEVEYYDTSECSSSFDGSDYGDEGDSEASSGFHGGPESELDSHESGKMFGVRRKLSSHWKSFIHPITWRCKWLELQIKKLEGQAQKYDRKLEEYTMKSTSDQFRSEVFKRKRRRRAEDTNDIATYMSNHNVFSYYENRKAIHEVASHVLKNPDAAMEVNGHDESWDNNEVLLLEGGDDDEVLGQILMKIEHLRSRVSKMKTRVDKVTREWALKYSYKNNLNSTGVLNALVSSSPNTVFQMPVQTYIDSQLMSEYNMGGVLLPEAVADHGEVARDPNGNVDLHRVGYDGVLIDNQRVTKEMHYIENVKIHSMQRPLVVKDDHQSPPRIRSISNPTAPSKSMVSAEPQLQINEQPSNRANAPRSNRGKRKGAAR